MLHAIYDSGDYPMVYNALIVDVNAAANNRAGDLSLTYIPTSYFDGGHSLFIGTTSITTNYRNRIEAAGARTVVPLNMITTIEWLGNNDVKLRVRVGNGVPANVAPNICAAPTGITKGLIDVEYTYSASTTDADADDIYYMWDYGDGNMSDWLGPFAGGANCDVQHTWTEIAYYDVKVKTKDDFGTESNWSPATSVQIECCINSGDNNHDGDTNISDLTYLVDYMFRGGPEAICVEESNINGIGETNISDLTYFVDYMFRGGPAPVPCP